MSKPARKRPSSKAGRKTTPSAPWDRENPKPGAGHTRLTPRAKAAAKRRARAAGRPYPNLVDNMRAARESKQ